MHKTFLKYVIPSMLAFALSGVYAIVDGFFVGNSIGDQGLAAINVAYPLTAFLQASGTGIGMAGAIHYAIYDGAKRVNERNRYLWIAFGTLLAASLFLMVVYLLLSDALLALCGAKGELLGHSREYIRYIIYGTFFQVLGTGLVPFIRNMGGSVYAMLAMIAGFFTNILLDYLLVWVFSYGMAGAALATIIGQGVTMLLCMLYLYHQRRQLCVQWDAGWKHQLLNIGKLAPSPFGLTFVPNVTLIFVNRSAIMIGGEQAVSTYAIVSYVTCVVLLLLQGISDGCQPLISLHYGEKDMKKVCKVRNIAYGFAFVTALLCMGILYVFRYEAAILFGASQTIAWEVSACFPLFIFGFLFVSISRITMSYFYATEKNKLSYLLIYGEPVLLLMLLQLLPRMMGINGTWTAVPLSQLLTALLAGGLLYLTKKHPLRTVHPQRLD